MLVELMATPCTFVGVPEGTACIQTYQYNGYSCAKKNYNNNKFLTARVHVQSTSECISGASTSKPHPNEFNCIYIYVSGSSKIQILMIFIESRAN